MHIYGLDIYRQKSIYTYTQAEIYKNIYNISLSPPPVFLSLLPLSNSDLLSLSPSFALSLRVCACIASLLRSISLSKSKSLQVCAYIGILPYVTFGDTTCMPISPDVYVSKIYFLQIEREININVGKMT